MSYLWKYKKTRYKYNKIIKNKISKKNIYDTKYTTDIKKQIISKFYSDNY